MNHTKLKFSAIAVSLAIGLSACSGESTEKKTKNVEVESVKQMESTQVEAEQDIQSEALRIGKNAANWQIAQFGNLDYIPESHRAKSENAKFWIQAAFYIGLTRWIDATDDEKLKNFVKEVAERESYELILERPYHADDHAIAQTYLWLAEREGIEKAYEPTKEVFDMILSKPSSIAVL